MSKDQSLVIAVDMMKRNKKKKKMAEGGEVNAKSQRRPMPEDTNEDSKMVNRNRGNKSAKDDSWGSDLTVRQAQKPSITKLSQPKIVQGDSFSVRNREQRDENNDQIDAFYPESDRAQPRKRYDEYGANRQGPKVSDMENQHSNGREAYEMAVEDQYSEDVADANMKKKQSPLGRYAKGGPVMQPKDHGQELEERTDEMDMLQNLTSSEHGEQPAKWRDELNASDQNQNKLDMEKQHNSGRKPYAKGGHIQYDKADDIDLIDHNDPNSSYGEHDSDSSLDHEMMDVPDEEYKIGQEDSIAAAIMAKKDRMKKILDSGSMDEDAAVKFYEGGQVEGSDESMVDIMSNGMEHPNAYYNRNENEVLKENYNDDMDGVSQPLDSNQHDTDLDSDARNMISQIRSKMKRQKQFKDR